MPSIHVSTETDLSAERVLGAARDFSERRAELWPDVHVEHFMVHGEGATFADLTEGTPWPIGIDYDCSQPSSVKGTVTDSNIFKPGSSWELRATASNGGSEVEVIGVRHLKGRR